MLRPMTEKRLVISTPIYGTPENASVSWGYHEAILSVHRNNFVHILHPALGFSSDLVRARSRAVRKFLESAGTHLLFWDEDVVPRDAHEIIAIMIGSDLDVIACPYPRKRIRWDSVALAVRDEDEQVSLGRQTASELQGESTDWPMRTISPEPSIILTNNDNGQVWPVYEANECAMGFTMLSRSCLERMCEAYRRDLEFLDQDAGKKCPTVALFQLMIRDGTLCSEDYSFCERWKDIGGKMWMLGDNCSHVGAHRFHADFRPGR